MKLPEQMKLLPCLYEKSSDMGLSTHCGELEREE